MTNSERDPLAYLLDDEPVPDDVRADPRFAEAENDIKAIKRGLQLVAARTPKPAKAQRSKWNGNVILAVAACTLAAVALGGLIVPSFLNGGGTQQGTETNAGAGSSAEEPAPAAPHPGKAPAGDLTEEGVVSCSTLVVDGVITDVQPGPTSELNALTLNVTRSYKSATNANPVTVTAYRNNNQRIGAKAFVLVSRFTTEPTTIFIGPDRESALQRYDKALTATTLPPCPGPG
jgi:hypothetical protein